MPDHYIKSNWHNRIDPYHMSDKQLEAWEITYADWRAEAEKIDRENQNKRNKLQSLWDTQAYGLAVQIWGSDDSFVQTIGTTQVPYPESAVRLLNDMDREIRNHHRNRLEHIKEGKAKLALMDKVERAITYLELHGLILRTDYQLQQAIEKANELAVKEAIAARIKNDDYPVDCYECHTWDGLSSRCHCGNRRMAWRSEGDFEDMLVFSEAY